MNADLERQSPRAQRRAAIVLAISAPLLMTWKYFGTQHFFLAQCGAAASRSTAAMAAYYRYGSAALLLGLIPLVVVKLVLRERLTDYGVGLGDWRRTLRSTALCVPIFLVAGYVSSRMPAIRAVYPINPTAGDSLATFLPHAAAYLLFYGSWEFYFRGFMLQGMRAALGDVNAVLVQTLASALVHIGDPAAEAFAAIAAGVLWGWIVLRTRSILPTIAQHATLGIALDAFICFGPR